VPRKNGAMPRKNRAKGVQLAVARLLLTYAVLPNDVSQSTSMLIEGPARAGEGSKGQRQARQPKGKATNQHIPCFSWRPHVAVTKQHRLSKRQTQRPQHANKRHRQRKKGELVSSSMHSAGT